MSRYFMIQSWVGSHENEPDYNGQQCGERNVRSIEAVPLYDQFGNANVSAFSDEAIASRNNVKKASTVSIKDRILPQFKRLQTLRTQMLDLEKEYKTTDMTCEEYSILRDVIVCKIERAEVLYKKAISVRPIRSETDEDSAQDGLEYTPSSGFSAQPNDVYASEEYDDCGVSFIDQLSSNNSFKKPLKIACTLAKTAVHWSHKAAIYYKSLKEA